MSVLGNGCVGAIDAGDGLRVRILGNPWTERELGIVEFFSLAASCSKIPKFNPHGVSSAGQRRRFSHFAISYL